MLSGFFGYVIFAIIAWMFFLLLVPVHIQYKQMQLSAKFKTIVQREFKATLIW